MYRLLYLKNSVFNRLFLYFQDYFSNASKPTARNLFLLVISILTLDIFRSVRFAYSHVISRLSGTSLNAFYYTLKTDAYDHSVWNDVTVSKAVRAVPRPLEGQPIFLSIDDTMVEKFGRHFELCSKLYDHAAHNGSITSMDTAWSASCFLSRYTGMGKPFTFPFRWVTGSGIRKKASLL